MTSKQPEQLEVLAVAAHPDDAEIFCGAFLALMSSRGRRTGVLDLTRGELGSQGTVEQRAEESARASAILELTHRENLELPDGALSEGSVAQLDACVSALRRLRPELLLLPFWEDRRPDHIQASKLLTRAAFFAGLSKYNPADGAPYRPLQTLYYQLRTDFRPSFIVDVSAVYERKLAAVNCYASQVIRAESIPGTLPTLVSSPLAASSIAARDERFGSMIGVKYGEAFLSRTALRLADPLEFFRTNPVKEPLASPEV